jgi:hypothetical protein
MLELYTGGQEEAAWAYWAEDAFGIAPQAWPEPGPFEGLDAIKAAFGEWDAAFGDGWQRMLSVERIEDLGDGRVLVHFSFDAPGAVSGLRIEQALSGIYTVDDGRIVRAQFFIGPEAEGSR